MSCTELAPLFLQRELGVLEEDELDRLEEHLDDCRTCPAWVARLEGELVAAQVPTEEPPADGWDALEQALDREEQATRLPIKVGLGCTYCHGRLVPENSIYCAACLAPHHDACFAEHGSCCAPGCAETSTVTRREPPPPPPAAPARGAPWPVVALLLLGAGAGAAAVTSWTVSEHRAPTTAALAPNAKRSPPPAKSGPTYEGKTAEEWIETLRDHSESLRKNARYALTSLGKSVSGPPLRRALEGDDFVLAWRAREALQEMKAETPIPLELYRRALRQPNLEIRVNAAEALKDHPSPQALFLAGEALRNADGNTRSAAREAVLHRDPRLEKALSHVQRALRDRQVGARLNAAELVGWLESVPPDLAPSLLAGASDASAKVRAESFSALEKAVVAGEPPATLQATALIARLTHAIRSDKTPAVREKAASCLASLNAHHVVDVAALDAALDDSALSVRLSVGLAFGKRGLKAERVVPRLAELIDHGSLGLAAIRALAPFGPAAQPAISNLRAALRKANNTRLLAIARTFAAIKLPPETLLALGRDDDEGAQWVALEVAQRRPRLYGAQAAALRDVALGTLNQPSTWLQQAGAKLLLVFAELDRPELKVALPSIASSIKGEGGDYARQERARRPVRATLLRALARSAHLDPPLAVKAFGEAILNPNDRWSTVEILTDAFCQRPLPGLTAALSVRLQKARTWEVLPVSCLLVALGNDADATSHVERAVLYGTSSTHRLQALRALALSQHPKRVTLIAQRLADRDSTVRKAAVQALAKAGDVKLLRRRVRLEEDKGVLVAIASALAARGDRATLPLLRRRIAAASKEDSEFTVTDAPGVLSFDDPPNSGTVLARRLAGAMIALGARDPDLLAQVRVEPASMLEARALVLAGEPAGLRALTTWLESDDPARRQSACEALGALGPRARAVRPAVEQRLKDPWSRVRAAAQAALVAIGK